MNEYDVKRLGLIFAIQAEIEGMKVTNIERELQGCALAYDEGAFVQAAGEIKEIVYKNNEQFFEFLNKGE